MDLSDRKAQQILAFSFIPRAIFGAHSTYFVPAETAVSSSWSASHRWWYTKEGSMAITETSPAMKITASGRATLTLTLFPLSSTPLEKNLTFQIAEADIGTSGVTWPW